MSHRHQRPPEVGRAGETHLTAVVCASFVIFALATLASCAAKQLPAGIAQGSTQASSNKGAALSSADQSTREIPWKPPKSAKGALTAQGLVEEGRRQGLDMEVPFEIDAEIARQVDEVLGWGGTPVERIRRIMRFLNDKGYVNFKYALGMSLTAKQAFRQKQGDCLAYTNLFMGIARHLRIPAYFVHIREAREYYEREGLFFINSHMAAGYGGGEVGGGDGLGLYTVVVDFTQETSGLGLQLYQSLDDAAATALFYNNVAVDHLIAGDIERAEKLLRFLAAMQPQLQELRNNLGVVVMRQGRYEEALEVFQEGIKTFPAYQPLYTNAVQAARGSHRPDVAQRLEEDAAKWNRKDPFFLFNQAVDLYQKKKFDAAAELFLKAAKLKPDNPSLECWLARAYLASGQTQKGTESFLRAQGLSPNFPLLGVLRDEFPALAGAPKVILIPREPDSLQPSQPAVK